ncbi:MAG: glycoside hydrolase family 57 protein [Candidatus Peribacteraceae bacterium]|nr:glycoside hydrolase family 57 protein [Candidatus Peribacteraceae bacterium]
MSHKHHNPSVCFYFQVHQPYRLKDVRITDIGELNGDYFDDEKNKAIFRKVAEKCYLPANARMLDMIRHNPEFKVSYSLSGVFIDQCREYGPDVLKSFQDLAATGNVEFLCETYYHSLAGIFSLQEFCAQVKKHADTIEELFGKRPVIFRNTELIFSNEIAHIVRLLGFRGILAEGADHVLHGRSPNVPFTPPKFRLPKEYEAIIRKNRIHTKPVREIKVLLKNYKLSDDVAFRFSNRGWASYPLHADTFADWIRNCSGHSINLFMDYETFGEHQWADTGIFDFLGALPFYFRSAHIPTKTPSEVITSWGKKPCDHIDAHAPVSWADTERDLSAWRGNHLQEAALGGIYALEAQIKATGSEQLLEIWRKLLTSDHFYYLCTKYWSDGDVHKYFSPYESPYEAYRRYSHVLEDLRMVLADYDKPKLIIARITFDEDSKMTQQVRKIRRTKNPASPAGRQIRDKHQDTKNKSQKIRRTKS